MAVLRVNIGGAAVARDDDFETNDIDDYIQTYDSGWSIDNDSYSGTYALEFANAGTGTPDEVREAVFNDFASEVKVSEMTLFVRFDGSTTSDDMRLRFVDADDNEKPVWNFRRGSVEPVDPREIFLLGVATGAILTSGNWTRFKVFNIDYNAMTLDAEVFDTVTSTVLYSASGVSHTLTEIKKYRLAADNVQDNYFHFDDIVINGKGIVDWQRVL